MERNPTQNLSSPLLKLHPCTFLFSSWEFPSSSSPPALVCVTATALIPQQTEQVFGAFWRSLMLLCQLDERPAKLLKDQKNVKKGNPCLAWAEPVGQERGRAVAGRAGAQSWKLPVGPCGFKGSAVELCLALLSRTQVSTLFSWKANKT